MGRFSFSQENETFQTEDNWEGNLLGTEVSGIYENVKIQNANISAENSGNSGRKIKWNLRGTFHITKNFRNFQWRMKQPLFQFMEKDDSLVGFTFTFIFLPHTTKYNHNKNDN